MIDDPTPPSEPKIGFGNLAFAVSISTAAARLQARYYRVLVEEGVPAEHAKDMASQSVVSLLESAGPILSSMSPAIGSVADLSKQAVKLVDHPLVKEFIKGSSR